MTVRYPLFVRKDSGQGTSPSAARLALAGLIAGPTLGGRPGVLRGMEVAGTTGWSYSVSAGHVATSKGSVDGVAVWANDAAATVSTSPAPASGSRIDRIYVAHRDVDASDPDSAPVIAVAQGAPGGTPSAPSIPAGAVELRRFTIPSGSTGTQGGTASDSGRTYTAPHGSPIPVTSVEQRNAITWGSPENPARVLMLDSGAEDVNNGSGWGYEYLRSGFGGSPVSGWAWQGSLSELPNNYLLRNGRERQAFFEVRRAGSTIDVAATGSISSSDREVLTVDAQDAPGMIVTGTYLYRDGGFIRSGIYYMSSGGTLYLVGGDASTTITQRTSGNGWSLRVFLKYTILPDD